MKNLKKKSILYTHYNNPFAIFVSQLFLFLLYLHNRVGAALLKILFQVQHVGISNKYLIMMHKKACICCFRGTKNAFNPYCWYTWLLWLWINISNFDYNEIVSIWALFGPKTSVSWSHACTTVNVDNVWCLTNTQPEQI